jgi:SsrA-binding protein
MSTETPTILNRKARMNYRVVETLEVGMVLTGTEVKSIRKGKADINHAFARVEKGEVVLYGSHVDEYAQGNRYNHDPKRERKLLLHRREIQRLYEQTKVQGRSLVPLKIYFSKKGKAKVELAICEGKTHGDRREDIKEQDAKREMDRAKKSRRLR